VERLESLIANGKSLPMTRNAIINRDAALNLIDELRVAVPEEVRAAKRINQEGERIIEKAQEEAERIVSRAQEQATYLIGERGLTEAAEDESRRIIGAAEDEADLVRQGADDYAAGVLSTLEAEVTRTLRGIERGLAMLDERRAAYTQEPEPETPLDDDAYAPPARYDEDLGEEEGASTVGRR
jgi:cell division septum initiation protein DivIVA